MLPTEHHRYRVLISTLPIRGHILPALSVAEKLHKRGHIVSFSLTEAGAHTLEVVRKEGQKEKLPCLTSTGVFDYEPVEFRLTADESHLDRVFGAITYMFGEWPLSQVADLEGHVAEFGPDVILADNLHVAPLVVARRTGTRSAVLGVTPYSGSAPGVAPFGSGLPYASSTAGVSSHRVLRTVTERLLEPAKRRTLAKWEESAAWRDDSTITDVLASTWMFEWPVELADAYLQCSVPLLEHPIRDPAGKLRFIGPCLPASTSPAVVDCSEVQERRRAFVTWGTMQAGVPMLFRELIVLLHERQVRVIGSGKDESEHVGWPDDVVWVSGPQQYYAALANASVFVTNGGFGGVKGALANGVPIVCFGNQDDKAEVGRRIEDSGAGISLRPEEVTPLRIADAVSQVMHGKHYYTQALRVADELLAYEQSDAACRAVEAVARRLK